MLLAVNRKDMVEAYRLIEIARMKTMDMIMHPINKDESVTNELLDELIATDVYPEYIKITIRDILPREADIPKTTLREHWLSLMFHALKDIDWKAEKVLCVIKVISTASYWDTDNRAYKFIIDSLRYKQIIPNDTHNNISYLVVGGEIDTENPRTEIYILEHPQEPLFFLSKKEQKHRKK